ncbi:MAG: DNA polymerase III subunit alpha [Abditibacteriales bacterium]|nr:DNA polymerase III subunit alpha [Abditibacteriales bacterium]MDW8364842.1 DNA polymerase III subunit alpha [Abditibacteriales bacterium]
MASKTEFVHLHVHSEFSLLDGASRVADIAQKAAAMDMPAVALTDHGVMYGVIDFYEACQKQGVKPIIGVEAYVSPRSRFDREPRRGQQDERNYCHLTLWAQDQRGYKNLIKLTTAAHLEGFYYKPRVDHELLNRYHEGLICASACLGGEIPQMIQARKYQDAKRRAEMYREIFGQENFYLELMDHRLRGQDMVNEALIKIARETGIPLVCTNDTHYTNREDWKIQDILLCIGTKKTLKDTNRLSYGDEYYLKTPQEMAERFADVPEALRNTLEIAERCNVTLELGKTHFPHFEVPDGHTLDSYLEFLCRQNLPKRYPHAADRAKAEERMRYELSVITQKGYAGYFLVVQDFINYAKGRGIPVGPGRGSAAGSIVSYLLRITDVDPLRYGLYFERFLNPARESNPDIDVDFPPERRDEILQYVTQKYGEDKVAQIIAFGSLKSRAAVHDVGRVMGMDPQTVDRVSKLIPVNPVKYIPIKQALEMVQELKDLYESNPQIKQMLDAAQTIELLTRHTSVHACGVVISRFPLNEVVPLQRMESKGKSVVVTQFEGPTIEKVGLVKMDFLGLDNSTVISETLRLIKERHGIEIDISNLPLDDKKTYDLLSRGEGYGVFQLESAGMRQLLKDLKPDNFEHIIAILALYRPGPMEEIPKFVAVRHGREKPHYLHPKLEPILRDTNGVITYQEQVMSIAVQLAGFEPPQAEILMRAMAKKQVEKMQSLRELFLNGCVQNGVERQVAEEIFARMETFSGYGFNRSHATGYALVSYQTAYLKAHYPQEFMAAKLSTILEKKDKLSAGVNECRKMGIEVLLPDVNESDEGFTIVGDHLRFGLLGIKNVGSAAVRAILDARREGGKFVSLFDFCERVPQRAVGKATVETLIKAGAFDSLHHSRRAMLEVLDSAMERGLKAQQDQATGQISMFGDVDVGMASGVGAMKATGELPDEPDVPELKRAWEKELLGITISDPPLLSVRRTLEKKITHTLDQLPSQRENQVVTVGGMVTELRSITARRGTPMCFFKLEDFTGEVEVIAFPSVFEKCGALIQQDALLLVKGKLDPATPRGRGSANNGDDEETTIEEVEMKILADEIIALEPDAALESVTEAETEAAPVTSDQLVVSRQRSPADGKNGKSLDAGERAIRNTQHASVVHIVVQRDKANPETLKELQHLLPEYEGGTRVILHLPQNGGWKRLRLGERYAVQPNKAFRRAVEKLLGEGAVRVEE